MNTVKPQRKARSYGRLSAREFYLLAAIDTHRIVGYREPSNTRYTYVLRSDNRVMDKVSKNIHRLECMGMVRITYHSATRASVTLTELGRTKLKSHN